MSPQKPASGRLSIWLGAVAWLALACADEGPASGVRSGAPLGAPPPEDTGPPQVSIDIDSTLQTLHGFGASTAWYMDTLVNHAQKDEIYAHAFAGLGLDMLRFRNRYQRTREQVDLGDEREILERATASLGHAPKLLISSWSPPASLKANGDDDCTGGVSCTLLRVDGQFVYREFGEYWATSLEEYARLGIVPDYISIQNEPDFSPGSWEGCRFSPSETDNFPGYDQALRSVSDSIARLDALPGLIGPENLGVHRNAPISFLTALDQGLLVSVAHHLYERGGDAVWDWREPGPDSYITPIRDVSSAARLPVFQTEFQTDEDNGIEGGFETAWLIHNSVEYGASAWLYWNLVWTGRSGLISMNGDDYTLRDQYYALRHYALHTEPGDVLVTARSSRKSALRASAFLSADQARLTAVLLNVSSEDLGVGVDAATFGASAAEGYLTLFRPGESQRWQELGALGAAPSVDLPSRSVLTLVFRR